MNNSEPAVRITLKELYDTILVHIGRVESVITENATLKERMADHENRLREVEGRRWPLPTVSIVVAAAALATNVVLYLLN